MQQLSSRTVAVAICAGALALAGASAAQARTLVHADRTTDVRRADLQQDNPRLVPMPRHHDGDIARVRFANGNVVGLRATFDELRPPTNTRFDLMRVVTNQRVVRTIGVLTVRGGGTQVFVERANGDDVTCHGVTHSADYTANVVVIHVPRRCLGNPRWVKVGYIEAAVDHDYRLLYIDDALRDRSASIEGTPAVSARIWRH